MREARRQLAASPVLIGAVTVLVAIVAVFISYSANQGLPFVPTYKLNAEIPNGAKLVPGNEVRAGGFRVGVVEDITVVRRTVDGRERSVARLKLNLDKDIEPLSVDTRVGVRPRSALGLKYVELLPGSARRTFEPGDTVPLRNAAPVAPELEDVLSTFAPRTRRDAQAALVGFGDAFAGRGNQINAAIRELRPFLVHLQPVMRNLSDPRSELRNLVPALAAAVGQAAPVAEVQARLFGHAADTFAALNRDPAALRETLEETPPTLAAASASFRVQTPFLARFADVSRRLGPGAAELRRALPLLNGALRAGVPALRRTPELGERVEQLLEALETLSGNPSTLLSLRDLRRALQVGRPALAEIAPYQTVCNYLVYFFNPLGTHQSEVVPGGTDQRILAKLADRGQPNSLASTESIRPVDVPTNESPQAPPTETQLQSLHTQYGGPAIDSSGRADCQSGQTGYPNRLVTDPRYPPDSSSGGFVGGGSHVVVDPDTPGLAGGTYRSRQLGIDHLEDIP
jgi:virulence factor Mce-like protein